jgi:hypothetical protein
VPSTDFYSLLQAADEAIASLPGSYSVVSISFLLLTVALDESGTSGSDYHATRQVKEAERRRKTEQGHQASDTESEDARLDHELSGDAVGEDGDSAARSPTKKSACAQQDAEDGDEEAEIDGEDRWTKTPGPLPKTAKAEAQAFGARVTEEAERIARKYKKSTRDVMLAAGLGIRTSRGKNPLNMFKRWYAHHHPNKGRKLLCFHRACC